MTEEQKQALIAEVAAKKAAKEKADAEAKKQNSGETEEEKTAREAKEAEAKNTQDIDYEAELKAEKERREKAEKALAEKAFKSRKEKRENEQANEEEQDEEDKPLTASQLEIILAKERQQTHKQLEETRAVEIARANTSTETEAQAALEFWKNRVVPTGNLEDDIRFAIGGLNSRRIVAQNEELKRALRSKETKGAGGEGTFRDAPQAGEPQLAPQDAQAVKQSGFVWDAVKKLYKKPLAGSKKTLYYDVKSKKRWVE